VATGCTAVATRMWANAQRDGRPAEHRCSNAAKTRKPLKVAGVPQTPEKISAASGPKFTILWTHVEGILLLIKFFFRLSMHALVAKI